MKHTILFLLPLIAALPLSSKAGPAVDLGTAGDFSVLAGSTVTNTGPTVINGGNVGVYSGSAITGFPPGTIAPPYGKQTGPVNSFALGAKNDLATAYNQAAGLAVTKSLSGLDLGGMTLTPGVYFYSSDALLTGTLTLDDQGDPNALFVFQIGSTLTTATGASVLSINTGTGTMPGCDVFWQVGSSATLGTDTSFEGHILALTSITMDTGATILDGSALAQNGAVTLDSNTISNCVFNGVTSGPGALGLPLPSSFLSALAMLGIATLGIAIKKLKSPRSAA